MIIASADQSPPKLDQMLVDRLRRDPSSAVRAETAASVAAEYSKGTLSDGMRRMAEEILARFAADIEQQVRQALADHVKRCPLLPRSIAFSLARDIEAVALPIIECSAVLNDADLIEIVRMGSPAKQLAVTRREVVSAVVADAIVDVRAESLVGALLANPRAQFSDPTLYKVVDEFGQSDAIGTLLVERPSLSLVVIQRLITRLSAALRQRLIDNHGIPPVIADELVRQGRERAITTVLPTDAGIQAEVERLVVDLQRQGNLTATLIFRALCLGDLRFFETALATLADIPVANARTLIHDQGPGGLKSLYQKAGLPPKLFRAFQIAVQGIRELGWPSAGSWQLSYTQRIIDNLVSEYEDLCPEDLEHLLSQMSRRLMQ